MLLLLCVYLHHQARYWRPVVGNCQLSRINILNEIAIFYLPLATRKWPRCWKKRRSRSNRIGWLFFPSPVETICNSRFKDEIEKVSFSTSSLLYISRIIRINAQQEEKEDWFFIWFKAEDFSFWFDTFYYSISHFHIWIETKSAIICSLGLLSQRYVEQSIFIPGLESKLINTETVRFDSRHGRRLSWEFPFG